jgi:hypothetical protein
MDVRRPPGHMRWALVMNVELWVFLQGTDLGKRPRSGAAEKGPAEAGPYDPKSSLRLCVSEARGRYGKVRARYSPE